jgi:hypothetical protein
LRTSAQDAVLIALPAVIALTSDLTVPVGDRTPPLELDLAAALSALAADRPTVRLELLGGKRVAGMLDTVGVDLISLELGPNPRRTALIPLDAVSACLL